MAKLRNFLITFVVAVLVFGAIAYVAVQSIMNPGFSLFPGEETTVPSDNTKETTEKPTTESTPVQSSGNDTTSSSEPVTDPPIEDDSCLTFLLVGTDYQPDVFDDYESRSSESGGLPDKGRNINADTIFLLHINKEKRYFVFSSLPPNLKISTASGIYTTLSDVYRQNGIESLIANVRSLTGLEADYYAVVSIPSCAELFDEIGTISFNVPCDMYYEDPEQNLVIDLKKGIQSLTGKQAVDLLRFNQYPSTSSSRLTVAVDLMKTVLTKVTQASYIARAPELYAKALDLVETNFSSDGLMLNIELFSSYKDYTTATVTYPCTKEVTGGRDLLRPDVKTALSNYSKYK